MAAAIHPDQTAITVDRLPDGHPLTNIGLRVDPAKIDYALRALASGKAKHLTAAAELIGLHHTTLSRMLSRPKVRDYYRDLVSDHISTDLATEALHVLATLMRKGRDDETRRRAATEIVRLSTFGAKADGKGGTSERPPPPMSISIVQRAVSTPDVDQVTTVIVDPQAITES